MRLATLFSFVSLLASGCACTTWRVDGGRHSIDGVAVVVEAEGDTAESLAEWRRAGLVARLRARGYEVRDAAPGVPLLHVRLSGRAVTGPVSDAYHVELQLSQDGRVIARGAADADSDPAPALWALALRLFDDVPPAATTPRGATVAAR